MKLLHKLGHEICTATRLLPKDMDTTANAFRTFTVRLGFAEAGRRFQHSINGALNVPIFVRTGDSYDFVMQTRPEARYAFKTPYIGYTLNGRRTHIRSFSVTAPIVEKGIIQVASKTADAYFLHKNEHLPKISEANLTYASLLAKEYQDATRFETPL